VGHGKGFDEHSEQIGFSQQNDRGTSLSLIFASLVHNAQGIVTEGTFFDKKNIFFLDLTKIQKNIQFLLSFFYYNIKF
jgi:hypothetical protein